MKAVDLEVSVISNFDSDFRADNPLDSDQCGVNGGVSKTAVNGSPLKESIGPHPCVNGGKVLRNGEALVSQQNGLNKESSPFKVCNREDLPLTNGPESLCRGVAQVNGTSRISPLHSSVKKETLPTDEKSCTKTILDSSVCQRVNGAVTQNLPLQNSTSPRRTNGETYLQSSQLLNGSVNKGYCSADDDAGNEKHSLESLTDVEVDGALSRSPPEDIPRALQVDSGLESAASSWDIAAAAAEAREHLVTRLRDELKRARDDLRLRDEEVTRLTRIRQEVEAELEELTASLFQEAHAMVRVANERQAAAEKALRESNMHVEVLTAEVAALKTLVLTSTPSRPNPHLHPQIDPRAKDEASNSGNALFRKHRRSPSHFNLKYGRENSPPDSPVKEPRPAPPAEPVELRDAGVEVDPVIHREFLAWQLHPTTDQSDPFISRVYREDIDCCLEFSNQQLAEEVRAAVQSGTVYIEAINEKAKTHFPKKCALLEAQRFCQYRMRLGEADTWHSISHLCRNRIIAVCDFLNYLNYIQRGLVKSSVNDMYWEIVRLRKEMVLARLGLPLTT